MAVKRVEVSTAVTLSYYSFEEREVYCPWQRALYLSKRGWELNELAGLWPFDMIHSARIAAHIPDAKLPAKGPCER